MEHIKRIIRDIRDFPVKGIIFRDITPVLADPKAFKDVIDHFVDRYKNKNITKIIGIESRGFIFGATIAYHLGIGFVPVRKEGKLPYDKIKESYSLEYGKATIEIHTDAINKDDNVVVFDDLIATGGTAQATCKLVEKLGGKIAECAFLVELGFLNGREKIKDWEVYTAIKY